MRVAYNGSARLSLDAIEHAVHEAHEAITRNNQDSLTRAMKAGDGLIEIRARQLIRHGQWGDLYRRTCGSVRTVQIYVKLAKARLFLEANAQSSACLSIDAALRFLRQHDGTSRPKTKKEATASSASAALAVNLTQILKLALSTTSAEEAGAALGRLKAKLESNGFDLHDISIALGAEPMKRTA
jgi:hypothetical protein